jgi:hypothetical protein
MINGEQASESFATSTRHCPSLSHKYCIINFALIVLTVEERTYQEKISKSKSILLYMSILLTEDPMYFGLAAAGRIYREMVFTVPYLHMYGKYHYQLFELTYLYICRIFRVKDTRRRIISQK